jgi:hypothetical protein
MNRNVVKIGLDAVMLLLLILLFKDRVISIAFHERAGLIIFALFLCHNGLNWSWIAAISRRFFTTALPLRTRAGYVVDALLLLTMAYIVLSGVMISRTVLVGIFGSSPTWRFGHFFASAVALVLVGIHLGLHWSFIRSLSARVLRLPPVIARRLGIAALVVIVGFGIYSVVTSSFLYWLASPLVLTGHLSAERAFGLFGNGGLTGSVIQVVVTYGSIIALTAVETVLVQNALRGAGRRQR